MSRRANPRKRRKRKKVGALAQKVDSVMAAYRGVDFRTLRYDLRYMAGLTDAEAEAAYRFLMESKGETRLSEPLDYDGDEYGGHHWDPGHPERAPIDLSGLAEAIRTAGKKGNPLSEQEKIWEYCANEMLSGYPCGTLGCPYCGGPDRAQESAEVAEEYMMGRRKKPAKKKPKKNPSAVIRSYLSGLGKQ